MDYGTAWVPVANCWTGDDVYYVAYQAQYDYPLPDIYFQSATDSWINNVYNSHTNMVFYGALTECKDPDPLPTNGSNCTNPSGDFVPYTAWNSLWARINTTQSSLDYSANIKYQ